MYSTYDAEEMTEEKRFQEIAWILAKGYLRMKKQAHTPDSLKYLDKSSKNTKKGLDCPAHQSVHVTTG